MNMKALVTGGAGFIGSTLVDRLLRDGWSVDVIDNLSTGKLANLANARASFQGNVRFHRFDIRSSELIGVIEKAAPDVIFHLAAQVDVRISVNDPLLDAQINVIGLLHVLEGARAAGTKKVVFSTSGGTIYGVPEQFPTDENQPQHPISPYGVSKKDANDYLACYHELHGLEYTALAFANVFGPRQDPHGEAGVVAIFAGRLLSGDPITIFGDGKQTRDFVYVHDVVDACARAATRGENMIINIGTGVETSVVKLHEEMAGITRSSRPPLFAPGRAGELERSCLDPTRAAVQLGWQPATPLRDGLSDTIDFFRDRG